MNPDTDIETSAAVLAWNTALGGATVAIPVERLSVPGPGSVDTFGFDESLGSEGLGYLGISDGRRIILSGIAPDAAREAAECGVVVVFEVETGTNAVREYPVDVAPSAPSPGM